MSQIIENKTFDEERALYASDSIIVNNCKFDGPADGESALKESKNVTVNNSFFNLRYPFWHDDNLIVDGCELTKNCSAALWYTKDATIKNTKLHGIKALRECANINIENCSIDSPEFGWSVRNISMKDTTVTSEHFMMRSDALKFENVTLNGKYSFQYIDNSVLENCNFDTKDAFWHAKNTVIKNSVIKGEYLGWYCENVTFDNCKIIGTQPLCYCKNLRLIDCEMIDADLAFEKSEVFATIKTPVISIKNPAFGKIIVPRVDEIIKDDPMSKAAVEIEV